LISSALLFGVSFLGTSLLALATKQIQQAK